jgi:hypothetical protein
MVRLLGISLSSLQTEDGAEPQLDPDAVAIFQDAEIRLATLGFLPGEKELARPDREAA